MALTDTVIRQAKAKEKDYKLSDAKGLYVLVTKTGSKHWRMKYRIGQKEKLLSIGTYPNISLKSARKACEQARDELDRGIDPSQAKKARKASQINAYANDLETIAREWHKQQAVHWSDSYSQKVLSSLQRDLFPFMGTLPISQISSQTLLQTLRRVEARGASESAHRLKQLVGQVFCYAVATGRAERDITPELKGALGTPIKKHFPAITEPAKVGRLLSMIHNYQGTVTVCAALKLAPLVFVRPAELRHAEWQEIDFEAEQWCIPGSKMKMAQDHIVPLSRQALVILGEQKMVTGHYSNYVFPSLRGPSRPMSDNAILTAFRTMGITKEEMTGHGFRAMARTLLDEVLDERVELIEHQLAHAVKDTLGRAYNRTKHLPQRKAMMQRWADYLDSLH